MDKQTPDTFGHLAFTVSNRRGDESPLINMFYKSRVISLIQQQEYLALCRRIKLANHKAAWVELSKCEPDTVERVEIYVNADGEAFLTATMTDGSMNVPERDSSYSPAELLRFLRKAKLLKH